MRPIPVPKTWVDFLSERIPTRQTVIAGPDGDLTSEIRPVDALVMPSGLPGYHHSITVFHKPEDDDLERLAAGGYLLIHFHGSIAPYSLEVFDEEPDEPDSADGGVPPPT